MTRLIVTGAATVDGRPIYMRRDGSWVDQLSKAAAVDQQDECDALLARARSDEGTVCDPYAIRVTVEGESVRAVSFREVIRAGGPTVAATV